MVITRKLKLYPPNKEKVEILEETALLQTDCVNFWVDAIRKEEKTEYKMLQTYYKKARALFSLGADMIVSAENEAIIIARVSKRKRIKSPHKTSVSITVKGDLIKIDKNNLGLTFGKGRFWIPFHSQEIPDGTIAESRIKKINGDWYCFLNMKVAVPKIKKYKRVLGVDLGLAKMAVVADKKGKNTVFFRGEKARHIRQKYYEMRKKLRPKLKQGNVYKLLKRIGKKESNWMTDANHKISRTIVNLAIKKKVHLAVERLTGITERLKFNKKTRRMIKGWSFNQLQRFISYKAHQSGLEMFSVDPRGTSKGCPKCGHTSRYNRRSQERFKCRKCDYESNADRVGAMNIAQRATELLVNPIAYGQHATALM